MDAIDVAKHSLMFPNSRERVLNVAMLASMEGTDQSCLSVMTCFAFGTVEKPRLEGDFKDACTLAIPGWRQHECGADRMLGCARHKSGVEGVAWPLAQTVLGPISLERDTVPTL